MEKSVKRTKCAFCKSEQLFMFLDLGYSPHSDQFRDNKDVIEEQYPLRLVQCENCGLVQLDFLVNRSDLFTKDYLYEASITSTAKKHWTEFVNETLKRSGKYVGNVLDIGSNDGTLLEAFKEKGIDVQGVDPCPQVAEIAIAKGIPTIVDFWKKGLVKDKDLIVGTNVFAHVEDHDAFMEAIDEALKPDGVFVFESPYLLHFLRGLEYDTVYHQHLLYLSLRPLIRFLATKGFEVFDVQFSPEMHGGSFRCFIARKGVRKVTRQVTEAVSRETVSKDMLMAFAEKVQEQRQKLMTLLWNLKADGKTIGIVSSPAKGMTLMNYCGIKAGLVDFITEKSKLKIGRYTPGSHMQIVSDDELIRRNPDYALLLAWNFADEIIRNNKLYKGIWIIPIPEVTLRTSEG